MASFLFTNLVVRHHIALATPPHTHFLMGFQSILWHSRNSSVPAAKRQQDASRCLLHVCHSRLLAPNKCSRHCMQSEPPSDRHIILFFFHILGRSTGQSRYIREAFNLRALLHHTRVRCDVRAHTHTAGNRAALRAVLSMGKKGNKKRGKANKLCDLGYGDLISPGRRQANPRLSESSFSSLIDQSLGTALRVTLSGCFTVALSRLRNEPNSEYKARMEKESRKERCVCGPFVIPASVGGGTCGVTGLAVADAAT